MPSQFVPSAPQSHKSHSLKVTAFEFQNEPDTCKN